MKNNIILVFLLLTLIILTSSSCNENVKSSTGLSKATAKISVQSNGLSVEQTNVKRRIELENLPGSIKHLYILSAYSGQTIIYSTVQGKVTSSGKRLTPSLASTDGVTRGFRFKLGDGNAYTDEVMGDDGTWGSSIDYLYWWDEKDIYHQHYISGGQILHLSDQPINASGVILNIDDGE